MRKRKQESFDTDNYVPIVSNDYNIQKLICLTENKREIMKKKEKHYIRETSK